MREGVISLLREAQLSSESHSTSIRRLTVLVISEPGLGSFPLLPLTAGQSGERPVSSRADWDCFKDASKSPEPRPHLLPLHHPRKERSQITSNVPITHTRTAPRLGKLTLIGYLSSSGMWEAAGREERNADRWCGTCGEGSHRPAQSDPPTPPRPSYSHFVRQPRVRRQCDLKGNLRPEEERGRVMVGQRDRGLGLVESKHLHGAAGLDTNPTPTPSRRPTSSAASSPT